MPPSHSLNPHPQDAQTGHNASTGGGALHARAHGHPPAHAAAAADPALQALIERGYVPVRQLAGKVVGVWGDARIRLEDGEIRPLKVGDIVKKGEVVLTGQDGIVQLEPSHETPNQVASDDVERAISQVAQGDAETAPAAGPNSGGAAGSLGEGLRVGRDYESVTPAAMSFGPLPSAQPAGERQVDTELFNAPTARADSESTAANTPVTFDPRANDTSTTAIAIVAVGGQPIDPNTPVQPCG